MTTKKKETGMNSKFLEKIDMLLELFNTQLGGLSPGERMNLSDDELRSLLYNAAISCYRDHATVYHSMNPVDEAVNDVMEAAQQCVQSDGACTCDIEYEGISMFSLEDCPVHGTPRR